MIIHSFNVGTTSLMKASSAVFLQELNFTELQESEKSFAN